MLTDEAKILVVEDDPLSQRVMQLALENLGYHIDIADTGNKALALFNTNEYALIFMDYGLPDITGVEVTHKIREFEKCKNKHAPIIALTAHSDFAKAACLAAGMDEFVTKPIMLDQLRQLLATWVKQAK